MRQYIDKSALVAELDRRIKSLNKDRDFNYLQIKELEALLSFLDTLEVKEVDLEKAARHYLLHEHISPLNEVFHQSDIKAEMQYHKDIENAFKKGFELGLKSKGE